MDDTHVCTPDQWGICQDIDRDWCPTCSRCTLWGRSHDFRNDRCSSCGRIWGEE